MELKSAQVFTCLAALLFVCIYVANGMCVFFITFFVGVVGAFVCVFNFVVAFRELLYFVLFA